MTPPVDALENHQTPVNDPSLMTTDARLRNWIEHAAHLLPTQGPITVFVHHNTLHAFEDLPFEQAVLQGQEVFDCEPYWPEQRYREELQRERIRLEDLRTVLLEDLQDGAYEEIAGFGSRYSLRLSMLTQPILSLPSAEIEWLVTETDLLDRFEPQTGASVKQQLLEKTRRWVSEAWKEHESNKDRSDAKDQLDCRALSGPAAIELMQQVLSRYAVRHPDRLPEEKWESSVVRILWEICQSGAARFHKISTTNPRLLRPRDWIHDAFRIDTDAMVHEVLIRFCAAFLDQGFASLAIPNREAGFLNAFIDLYSTRLAPTASWMRGLPEKLRTIRRRGVSATELIAETIEQFGIAESQREEFLQRSLLALRGWAGMLWQLERHVPWVPKPASRDALVDFLAVRLLLDFFAAEHIARERIGDANLRKLKKVAAQQSSYTAKKRYHPAALTLFQLAQARGWSPQMLCELKDADWQLLLQELHDFSAGQRRRIFHLAYERHYHSEALTAIASHCTRRRDRGERFQEKRAFQVVCCIDDREESFRRHLEEVDPQCETLGAAGFFGVAMYYQGATHAHYRPLCPAVVTPQHYVREEPVFSAVAVNQQRSQRRRILGSLSHQFHSNSKTFFGGLVTTVFGSLATFPLVARVLAPRLTSRIRDSASSLVRPPATELHVERVTPLPGPEGDALGYSHQEMADIVIRVLQDTGLKDDLSRIVLFLGHGSSSLNNPHDSAYSCGACSGGRGGPNARAFAMMANDPRVRNIVAESGILISSDTWFVGGYHNTCNDRVDYYDLDRLPRSHRELFRRIEQSIAQATRRNSHERARRFEGIPLGLSQKETQEWVERRAEDLSEARPEYNHATNALCLVGNRWWSRGLFLDRRAFLTSYDPSSDDAKGTILARILQAVIPVCAGISLEYYFSTVDNEGYGCGSKLPHNVASMLGVMTGAASDLRPGLSAQMVEIHEPMRIMFVIESSPKILTEIIENNPVIARLVKGEWVKLAVLDSETSTLYRYHRNRFETAEADTVASLPVAPQSLDWYHDRRNHLGFASIPEKASASSTGMIVEVSA